MNAGGYHSIALRQDGTVWAWGNNGNGRLGNGSIFNQHSPVQMILSCTVTAPTLGLQEDVKLTSWTIYPNPFSSQTTLQTDIQLHNATLTVDNCYGQTVAQIKNLSGQTVTFSRGNLPSGLYFVRITTPSLNPSPNAVPAGRQGGGPQGGGSEVIATGKLVITD